MHRKPDISLLRTTYGTPAAALLLAALLVQAIVFLAPASAGAQGTLAALQSDLAHQMAISGSRSSAYVYDISTKQPLYSARPTTPRPPASVEKLFTATAALQRLGPTTRLSTTVFGTGQLGANGVWEGDLYLKGGGDPTFGDSAFIRSHYSGLGASVSTLVNQLVRTDGIRAVRGSVYGDESVFDAQRGEPSSGYRQDPFLEGTLSGLAFDRGASGSEKVAHAPAAYAARKLWAALKNTGVSIRGASAAATTPAGGTQLAQVSSPTIAQLLALMLPPSDNFFAETLLKGIGARFGGDGTTTAGAAVVRSTLASRFGIHPRLNDGSGLSRSDFTTPRDIVTLLRQQQTNAPFVASLAIAGETGTLQDEMKGTIAQGKCEGKTGTLHDAANLVGYCTAADGHTLAFAFLMNSVGNTDASHLLEASMAVSVAKYNG
jgi:D-alanyl-D-alanine carboxypeptidase/D-alanyl-D-alanine-endopeptidase (penicillin-binding protein 4)